MVYERRVCTRGVYYISKAARVYDLGLRLGLRESSTVMEEQDAERRRLHTTMPAGCSELRPAVPDTRGVTRTRPQTAHDGTRPESPV